jgi:hypothetical protein
MKLLIILGILIAVVYSENKIGMFRDQEPMDSRWLKKRMITPPDEWRGLEGNQKLSDWNVHPKLFSTYRRHGPRKPHRLYLDSAFFHNKELFFRHNSKFWTYVFYPIRAVWHFSSLMHVDYFVQKMAKTGRFIHPVDPFVSLQLTTDEGWFRGIILWALIPFLLLPYTAIIGLIRNEMVKDDLGY